VAKIFDVDSTLTIDLRASLDGLYASQVAHAYKGDTVIKVRPSRERKARMGRPWYEDDKKMQLYHEGEDDDDDNYGGEESQRREQRLDSSTRRKALSRRLRSLTHR
jgi:hypothetical protein